MNQKHTRVARWLATQLALSGARADEFATILLREGSQLGFSEPAIRAAIGEIGATVERYSTSSERWRLDATRRQFWTDWAGAHSVPAPGARRDVVAAYWCAAGSPAIATARAASEDEERIAADAERLRRWTQEANAAIAKRETEERQRIARYRRDAEQFIANRTQPKEP